MFKLIIIAVIVLLALGAVGMYNGLIKLRNLVQEAWRQIDVELKRRHDLIPNLVEVVKGYAAHERTVFENVVRARNAAVAAMGAGVNVSARESELMRGLRGIFAIAEAYPNLKADGRYADLQLQLADTEDRIAATRRLYNGNVRDWRALRDSFPALIIARMFGFAGQDFEFFELAGDAERVVPRVGF